MCEITMRRPAALRPPPLNGGRRGSKKNAQLTLEDYIQAGAPPRLLERTSEDRSGATSLQRGVAGCVTIVSGALCPASPPWRHLVVFHALEVSMAPGEAPPLSLCFPLDSIGQRGFGWAAARWRVTTLGFVARGTGPHTRRRPLVPSWVRRPALCIATWMTLQPLWLQTVDNSLWVEVMAQGVLVWRLACTCVVLLLHRGESVAL